MPSKHFKPAGAVTFASYLKTPPLFTTVPVHHTKAQKDGLRYEKRVQGYIHKLIAGRDDVSVLFSPWLMYHNRSAGPTVVNFCQPDAVILSGSKVTIVECKLQHTNDSWQQLRLLYEPVLRKIYKDKEFALVEICKWYDSHAYYAESFYYCENVLEAEVGKVGIHIYKPRGRSS